MDVLEHFGLTLSYISTWTVWQKILGVSGMRPLPYLFCTVHQRRCAFQSCDLDISGFPCTDYSPMGQRKGIHGKTFIVLLCLLAWHRSTGTRIVCLENVVQFPLRVLEALMSDLYEIYPFQVETADSGCEHVSRRRLFILLLRRGLEDCRSSRYSYLLGTCLVTPLVSLPAHAQAVPVWSATCTAL